MVEYSQAVEAVEKLLSKSKHDKSTSLKSSIAAMFTADDKTPLKFSGEIGMLQLDFDRECKSHFLRFYSLDTLQLLMQAELFYGFGDNYRQYEKSTLYIFDYFTDGVIGFQFRTKEEAQIMEIKIKSASPKLADYKSLMKEKIEQEENDKKQSSFFGRMKKKIGSIINKDEEKHQSVIIKVQKKTSVTFNPQTGEFDGSNLQGPMMEILEKAGVKKKDLKNKAIMELIFQETLLHQAKKIAEEHPEQVDDYQLRLIKTHFDEEQSTVATENEQQTSPQKKVGGLLPPPPPLTIQPDLPEKNVRSTTRNDLMNEIRNNKLKLKPVKATNSGLEFDTSSMNKQEMNDLASHIREKLKKRKMALNRRGASDSEESD